MAIRPEALPTDAAALTEMVLALDAENEKLRVAMQTLKEMIFGKRSERLAAIVAEQLALELADLATDVTPPAPANDDVPVTKPAGKPRKKARRNIGALPKHLPRCEQVLEPDTTACPCCRAFCTGSARMSARCWTSSRRSCACCARSVPNMAAAPALTAWSRRRCCRA
jgi:transposase